MNTELEHGRELIGWYDKNVRSFLERIQPEKIADFDQDCKRLSSRLATVDEELSVCFLGNSGVGKSTLINAMIGGLQFVVPFGGIGPLTAQAVIVQHGDEPGFEVEYHKADRLSQTIFALEQFFKGELGERPTGEVSNAAVAIPIEPGDLLDLDDDADDNSSDSSAPQRLEDRKSLFRRRAQLMVTGSQHDERSLRYLIDCLREAMGNQRVWGTQADPTDVQRIRRIQVALALASKEARYRPSAADPVQIEEDLRHHATGFLAPLIKRLTVRWPSSLLATGVALVDLPGVGIERDVHSEITRDWIRNRASALVLVVDHRGMTTAVAQSLRNSEFLNRLLYSADEPQDDPVVLVAVTRIDDDADVRRSQDRTRNKATHFLEACTEAREKIRRDMQRSLEAIWLSEGERTDARERVVNNILSTLQVHPVSAPQYRKFLAEDEDDPSFLKSLDQSGVPQFVSSLAELARERRSKAMAEYNSQRELFQRRLETTLRLIEAQWEAEGRAEEETARLREDLEVFMQPLRRELSVRQGAYGSFLKKGVPKRIADLVGQAKLSSREEIRKYLRRLGGAHWKTLQASVRKGGQHYGASDIDLPNEFALRFEEPIAEVWSKQILNDIRLETRSYAEDLEQMVEDVVDWALQQGARVQQKLVEAQRDSIRSDAKKLQNVGREMVKEKRAEANAQLVSAIEGPIKRACADFVRRNLNQGAGVKERILRMYDELPEKVTDAAEPPATRILQQLFKEVEKEISDALSEHQNPLDEVGEAILSSQKKFLERSDAQRRRRILLDLETIFAQAPSLGSNEMMAKG